MPLVEPPKDCHGCGACCHDLIVELEPNEESPGQELIKYADLGHRQMKQREDGSCVALDRTTMLCTVYGNRPKVCRDFGPGDNQACLDCVYKGQQIVMDAAAKRVDEVLRWAAEFALACGYAPTIKTKRVGRKSRLSVLFQPTLVGPDIRPEVLDENLRHIRDSITAQIDEGKAEGA